MSIRSFLSFDKPTGGIFDTGWSSVGVYRFDETATNVGVTAEMDERIFLGYFKVRLDPIDKELDSDRWIGTMDRLNVKLGDIWEAGVPKGRSQRFKVVSVRDNDIVLERM